MKVPSAEYSTYVLGMIMGCLATLALSTIVLIAFLHYLDIEGIFKYQTLIAGFAALLAALLTVYMIRDQIRQTYDLAEDRLRRESYAARTVMPAALAGLSGYAAECLGILKSLRVEASFAMLEPTEAHPRPPTLPRIPDDAIRTLKDCVVSGGSDAQKAIADLVARLQVQNSRFALLLAGLEGRFEPGNAVSEPHHLDDYFVDAIEVHARCGMLFEYARRRSEAVDQNVSLQRMTNAAMNNSIHDHEFPSTYEMICTRFS